MVRDTGSNSTKTPLSFLSLTCFVPSRRTLTAMVSPGHGPPVAFLPCDFLGCNSLEVTIFVVLASTLFYLFCTAPGSHDPHNDPIWIISY